VSGGSASDGRAAVLSGPTRSRAGGPLQIYAILFAQMKSRSHGEMPSADAERRLGDGRRLRGARSRARIREAARALFQERGFDAATLRAIAARAGMGASSIYRHVQSKHELLVLDLADVERLLAARTDVDLVRVREYFGLFDREAELDALLARLGRT